LLSKSRGVLVTLSILTVAIAGCSTQAGSAIALSGDKGPAGVALDHVPTDQPQVFTTETLCVTRGPVSPSSVSLVSPAGGIRLVDWGLREVSASMWSSGLPGAQPGRALSLPSFAHAPITGRCADKSAGSMLAFSVESAGPALAKADGIRVSFRSDGSTRSVLVPYHVALCIAACPKHPWDDGFV
jgi:hypothetical protein